MPETAVDDRQQAVTEADAAATSERRLRAQVEMLERRVRKGDEQRRAMLHIMSDLNEFNKRLTNQRKAMLHILADYEEDRRRLASKTERLNNPLNNTSLFVGNAIDRLELGGTDNERIVTELRHAMQQVRKATEIISHLRTFGRAAPLSREPICLRQVVERALSLMEAQLRVREVEVTVDLGVEEPVVVGRALHVERVFINLLTNARDALADAPRKAIRISAAVDPAAVEIAVADTGHGIPPELERRIFDPFFTTKEVGKGMGLGLSITYGIIKEHGGTISVVSAPGEGAAFLIHLPLAPAATEETSAA